MLGGAGAKAGLIAGQSAFTANSLATVTSCKARRRVDKSHEIVVGPAIAAVAVLGFVEIEWRFACTLPLTGTVLRPFVGMLRRVKHQVAMIHFNKPHRLRARLCFRISRTPIQQRSVAVYPKLMLQQNIARIFDERMGDLKIHYGSDLSSTRKLFPPTFRFELVHAESAFHSQQSGTPVSQLVTEISRVLRISTDAILLSNVRGAPGS